MQIGIFQEYIQGKYGNVIDGLRNTNGTRQGVTIQFVDGTPQATQDLVLGEIATFDFNPPAPNYKQFLLDVFADGAITITARRDVSQMGLWYSLGHKQVALAVWQLLSGGASADAIRQHAANNNFTLP